VFNANHAAGPVLAFFMSTQPPALSGMSDAAGAVLALRQQVSVHLVDDVADRLFSDLEVVRLRAVTSGVHDGRHVDSAPLADETPEQTRYERQHRLHSARTQNHDDHSHCRTVRKHENRLYAMLDVQSHESEDIAVWKDERQEE